MREGCLVMRSGLGRGPWDTAQLGGGCHACSASGPCLCLDSTLGVASFCCHCITEGPSSLLEPREAGLPIKRHGGLALCLAWLPFQGDVLQEGLGGLWSLQKTACSGRPPAHCRLEPQVGQSLHCHGTGGPTLFLTPRGCGPCPGHHAYHLPALCLDHLLNVTCGRPTTPIPRILKALSFCLISLSHVYQRTGRGGATTGAE